MLSGKGMLKALLASAFAVAMCVALAACGGSPSSGSAASSASSGSAASSASSASSSAAPTAADFAGEWQLAALELSGITVVGDFSGQFAEQASMKVTLNEDGTGTVSSSEKSVDLKWSLGSNGTPAIEAPNGDTTVAFGYENGAVTMISSDEQFEGTAFFTKDGTFAGVKPIGAADAKPVASEADVIGSWHMVGASMSGMTLYGDPESLAQIGIPAEQATAVFEQDGSAQAFGENTTWGFGPDGATVNAANAGSIPVMKAGDYLAIDMTPVMGVEMLILLGK